MIRGKKAGVETLLRENIGLIIAILALLIIFAAFYLLFGNLFSNNNEKLQIQSLMDKMDLRLKALNELGTEEIFIYGPVNWYFVGFTETSNYNPSGDFEKTINCFKKNCICGCKLKDKKSCICKSVEAVPKQGDSLLYLELKPMVLSVKRTEKEYLFQITEGNLFYLELSEEEKENLKSFYDNHKSKFESDFEVVLAYFTKLNVSNETIVKEFFEKANILKEKYPDKISMQALEFKCSGCVEKYCEAIDYNSCRQKLPEENKIFVDKIFAGMQALLEPEEKNET